MKYEDLTREERAKLLLSDPEKYMALVGPEQLLLILDGIAKASAYEPPPPEEEETWRRMLREQR